jgi:ADP-ribose pyrophosphatase YjhB (NUDIX family)
VPSLPPQIASSLTPVRPVAAAIAAVIRGDEILLVCRGHAPNAGRWALPGGKIEFGESVETAALRELFEETQVRAEALQVFTAFDVFDHNERGELRQHYILIAVLCRWVSGNPQAGDDARDARWFQIQKLASAGLPLTAGLTEIVQQAAALNAIR